MHSLFRCASRAPAPMPILSFPGKKALPFTGDTSAAERDADLATLMLARGHVVALASDSSKRQVSAAEAAAALRAYLRIVYASEMNGASRHRLLRFAWLDAGPAGQGSSGGKKKAPKASSSAAAAGQDVQGHTSLATEHAVALFALAAELARAATEEDRSGTDGITRACAALSDAAGALSAAAVKARAASEASGLCHMTEACLAAFERLMLVQAHECCFELAVAGGEPAALCSKIARQISLDYQQVSIALDSLQQQPIDKSLAPHAQAKAAYFHAEACLLHARALLLEKGAGCVSEAIAWLQYARSSVLGSAGGKDAIKKSTALVRDAAARLRREVETELATVEKGNRKALLERVPGADVLPALPGLQAPLLRSSAEEKVLREPDGEAALARGGAPTAHQ